MALPPQQPVYILRGHASTIHSLLFTHNNTRLISGDADGWIVVWSVALKRPTAVWKAHDAANLGIESWEQDKLITQGRDGKVYVWQLREGDEAELSKQLPVEDSTSPRKQPWLLHSLPVSNLTFCSFATCSASLEPLRSPDVVQISDPPTSRVSKGILLATPGVSDSAIHITHLPSERIVAEIPAPAQSTGKSGMIMALRILYTDTNTLLVIGGYESGRTFVFKEVLSKGVWETVYTARPHDQPILSLDLAPGGKWYFTSSADAVVAKHSLLDMQLDLRQEVSRVAQTGHAGQQGLRMRGDGKVFATAGWDGRGRVYSGKSMKELAVLKWHKEGCYATAFADVEVATPKEGTLEESKEHTSVVRRDGTLTKPTVEEMRNNKAQTTHWLALGSKDGKISLWDIY